MFIKILSISILLSIFLQASTYDLEDIKKDFYKKVVIHSNHKKSPNKFNLSESYFNKAKIHLLKEQDNFTYTQFVALVDLSQQVLVLTIWDNDEKDFFPIGFDYISSGDINREIETKTGEDHYVKTPAGLFDIKSGWRSDGKMNDENTTKPYGNKGRFVFFFGIQDSVRYNSFDKDGKKIKDKKKWILIKDKLSLAMHAHSLRETLGKPQSHGCIRMSEELNKFLDNNFVFFANLLDGEKWTHPYEPKPKNPKNYQLAGKYVLIIDSVF
ncbi:L,D-transpeptidase [Sulfurimonas sp.]|uniref:L,D-transpeptidase n=1 Tax=Sulfurimonas sp. TaxID=2022749 RepID=UPI00356B4B26